MSEEKEREVREREAEAHYIEVREEIQKVRSVKIESYLQLFHSFLELSKQGVDIYDDIKRVWENLTILMNTYLHDMDVAHSGLQRRTEARCRGSVS